MDLSIIDPVGVCFAACVVIVYRVRRARSR
jgi:hypothetical protein